MSDDFIPVMCSIVDSSITSQPAHVFKAWILMLATGGIEGRVVGAPGNLARRFGLSREEMEDALRVLSSPDPDSTTPDEEGRRIVPYLDAGRPAWAIVNRKKYHDIVVEKLRKDRDRRRKAEERARPSVSESVQGCPGSSECVQVVPVGPQSPPGISSSSSSSSSEVVTEGVQGEPPESLATQAAEAAEAGSFEWSFHREIFAEAFAVIWSGWRIFSGRSNDPIPKTFEHSKPLLLALATGRTPDEIRDALAKADPNCWARGRGPSAALRALDSLGRPDAPPGAQRRATEALGPRKSDLQRLRESEGRQ